MTQTTPAAAIAETEQKRQTGARPGTGLRRATAVAALVTAPVLTGVSVVLQPDAGTGWAERLEALAGAVPGISAVAFLVSQLFLLGAVLAIGRLLRGTRPLAAAWGTGLGVLGAFGHTAFGGMTLVWLGMANDGAGHRQVYADLLESLSNGPAMLTSMLGTIGTVVGLLVLSIGLFRSRAVPRWIGPALWAFLVVEFVGTSVTESAAYLSVLLFAAPLLALAVLAARRPRADWA